MLTKNLIISGTNYWNPGDDFVRDGVIAVLREVFPGQTLNFQFYNFNADFFPQSKFSGIGNFLTKGDLDQCRESIDAIVIAGLSAGDEIKDLYRWIIANKLEKKVILIGAGYENTYVAQHIEQEPEAAIFRNARIILGRTEKVPEFFSRHRVPYRRIKCPAILSVKSVKNVPEGKKIEKIGFSIQLSHEEGLINHSCDKTQSQLAVSLLLELSSRYAVEVVAHHKSEYFYFLRLLRGRSIPVIFSAFYQDLHSIYPRYDLVITTRLHSSLFANGHGIPGIIVNDTDRHTHTLEGFPHSVWVASRADFDHEFQKLQHRDLAQIAHEAQEFKSALTREYVGALAPVLAPDLVKRDIAELPIHFFTIVLNGRPFIEYHIQVLKQLPFKWHWHIVEGVAELKHDTAWSLQTGGCISDQMHSSGLSNDGTSEYLDKLVREFPDSVTVYRKPRGQLWEGKLEMVNKPLEKIKEPCLLWQIDADELWTLDQLVRVRSLFAAHPDRTAAFYFCHYFVGEDRVVSTRGTYGNQAKGEWLRTWRFSPGAKWTAHEPPQLCQAVEGKWVDVATLNPFCNEETEFNGLIFQHYAYATRAQLQFKEIYYGYPGAVQCWERLQGAALPAALKDYFPWVTDSARIDSAVSQGIRPFARKDAAGSWHFTLGNAVPEKVQYRRILFMRTDSIGDGILATGILPHLRRKFPGSHLAVFCQDHIKEIYSDSAFCDEVIGFDKEVALREETYRKSLARELQAGGWDLVIQSVYSREPLTDEILPVGGTTQIVGLEGDLSNVSDAEKRAGNIKYTRLISSPGEKTELERHRDLLAGFGIEAAAINSRVCLSAADRLWAKELFERFHLDPSRTLAVFPGAQYGCKVYRNYPSALRCLIGYRFIIFGGADAAHLGEQLETELPNSVLNLCGKTTLLQMAAAMQKCRAYVGADSAGAHLACALGLPNVVVMGGGHFGRFLPYSALTSLVCLPLECYGCNWICAHKNACVADISPQVVFEAVHRSLLAGSAKPRIFMQAAGDATRIRRAVKWARPDRFIPGGSAEVILLQSNSFWKVKAVAEGAWRFLWGNFKTKKRR